MTYYTIIIIHALTNNAIAVERDKLLTFEQCRWMRTEQIEKWRKLGAKVHVICYPTDRLEELYPWKPENLHSIIK